MDARRVAYRAAVVMRWLVLFGWGWAIWHDWDDVVLFWFAFGVAMVVCWALGYKPQPPTERSIDWQRL